MSDANDLRGEVSIEMEGVSYVMRPSYEAQVAIERQTGRSVRQLAQAAGDGSLTIEHAAIVVAECVKAQGRAVNDGNLSGFNAKATGEALLDAGMLQACARIELLLYLAATGGYTAKGERKPATTTETA